MVLRRRGSISRTFWFYGLSYKLAIVKSFKANARNDSIYIINSVDETKSILNHNGPVDPFIWNEDGNSSFFCLKKKKKNTQCWLVISNPPTLYYNSCIAITLKTEHDASIVRREWGHSHITHCRKYLQGYKLFCFFLYYFEQILSVITSYMLTKSMENQEIQHKIRLKSLELPTKCWRTFQCLHLIKTKVQSCWIRSWKNI